MQLHAPTHRLLTSHKRKSKYRNYRLGEFLFTLFLISISRRILKLSFNYQKEVKSQVEIRHQPCKACASLAVMDGVAANAEAGFPVQATAPHNNVLGLGTAQHRWSYSATSASRETFKVISAQHSSNNGKN